MFGEATENVMWQTAGMAIRGNDHVVQRNVLFGTGFQTTSSTRSTPDIMVEHWDVDDNQYNGICNCAKAA